VEVFAEPADMARRDEAERLLHRVADHFGPVDVLVNVAGVITVGPLLDQTLEDFEQVMADNFWTAVNSTFAVLPQMLVRRRGRIVNITSLGSKVSVPHLLPYSASKFGLYGFSSGLHAELAKEGIGVTTVVPGLMRTGSYLNTVVKGQYTKEFALFSVVGSLPLITMGARRAARPPQ
jgi:short-subunit dehydrogenase